MNSFTILALCPKILYLHIVEKDVAQGPIDPGVVERFLVELQGGRAEAQGLQVVVFGQLTLT